MKNDRHKKSGIGQTICSDATKSTATKPQCLYYVPHRQSADLVPVGGLCGFKFLAVNMEMRELQLASFWTH